MDKLTKLVEEEIQSEEEEDAFFGWVDTGSTLLNLALSDKADGGFSQGSVVNVVGDSSSGKTFAALTLLAMCVYNDEFKDHKLIHDDVENRCMFDMTNLFGAEANERVVPPGGHDKEGMPVYSETIEDFQDHIHGLLEDDQSFIYVLDSLDAASAIDDDDQYEKEYAARKKGKDVAGSYGLAKPKAMSEMLRRIKTKIKRTNSLLIIISQTRTNIGFGFKKKRRAGGDALTFYCQHVAWLAAVSSIETKKRKVGCMSRWKIEKNSITGKERYVDLPILNYYGIDNTASMIDFLANEDHWQRKKNSIVAEEFDLTATKEKLISHIEEHELEDDLAALCEEVWLDIEASLIPERKGRFS